MNLLIFIIIILLVIVALEIFKHQLTKNMFKYFIAVIILIIILLIISAYIDLGDYIGEDSTFAKTGSVIAEGIVDSADSIKESEALDKISDKTNELTNNIIDD